MDSITLKGLTVPVSRMIYGTAIQALMSGGDADEILNKALEAGITTFDTARSYDQSEDGVGRWVEKNGLRDRVNILTKGCNPDMTGLKFSPESLRGELEESLRRLKMDYVDLYALHRDDPTQDVSVFIDTLNRFADAGKIRVFGASNWHHMRMDAANEYAYKHGLRGFAFGSPAFSLAEIVGDPWGGSVHLSGEGKKDARKWFRENNIPVFPYSSFARGFFSGKFRTDSGLAPLDVLPPWTCEEYVCEANLERLRRAEQLGREKGWSVGQINLAWILKQDFICCPIFSPSTVAHMDENLKGLEIELTKEQAKWLNLEDEE